MPRQSQYPMIVKLHGKHDPTYYIVNSREDEYRAYYSILADHASMGYYPTEESLLSEMEHTKKRQLKKLDSTAALYLGVRQSQKVDELPEPIRSSIKEKLDEHLRKEARIEQSYAQEIWFAKSVKKILDAPVDEAIKMTYPVRAGRESSLIAALIMIRSEHEYEWVETLSPHSLPGTN